MLLSNFLMNFVLFDELLMNHIVSYFF